VTNTNPNDLVRRGTVHSSVYTSPQIFELEVQNIFNQTWMFVGHESEIPKPGDFRTRKIGRQPVIFVRGKDNAVRVLVNRCRHRGALVCEIESGRADRFVCWYHGWTYDSTGALKTVTGADAYGPEFKAADYSLSQFPRVESYRGFVFASGARQGPSLAQHLGLGTATIDLAIDVSPTGDIAVDQGAYKTAYRGNWKLVGMDGYHPNVLHASVLTRFMEAGEGHFNNPWADTDLSVTRDLGNGHSMLDLTAHRLQHFNERLESLRKVAGGRDYILAMNERYGAERAKLLMAMAGDPHVGFFPNLQLIGSQVRIVNPIAADRTEVIMMPMRLVGVSDEINQARLRHHEMFYGPAGAGSPDDVEIFERVQQGLEGTLDPWINVERGMHREKVQPDGSVTARIGDELPQRSQFAEWKRLMSNAPVAAVA
jgi:phenylpropionate dioxygenase-like ring-hydroxylating dioxygenase large terminal subunit